MRLLYQKIQKRINIVQQFIAKLLHDTKETGEANL